MREITNRIINRIPNFYTRDDRSVLLTIIDSIVPEIETLYKNIDVVSDMISINKVHDDDLFNRFGSMLNIYKYSYETNDMYRSRIVASIAGRHGGIISSIKGAIASYIGLFTDIDKYIYICGSWEYDNRFGNISNIDKSPGNMVCAIDPDILVGKDWVTTEGLIKVINGVKASGVNVYTTYVFSTLYDSSDININEQCPPISLVSNINEDQSTKIYDSDRLLIYIGLVNDDTTVKVDDTVYTTYVFSTLYDSSDININEQCPPISLVSNINEDQSTKIYDSDRLLIYIGLVNDDTTVKVDDTNSLLNDNRSLLNSSFVLNKLNCYDIIDEFLFTHQ